MEPLLKPRTHQTDQSSMGWVRSSGFRGLAKKLSSLNEPNNDNECFDNKSLVHYHSLKVDKVQQANLLYQLVPHHLLLMRIGHFTQIITKFID